MDTNSADSDSADRDTTDSASVAGIMDTTADSMIVTTDRDTTDSVADEANMDTGSPATAADIRHSAAGRSGIDWPGAAAAVNFSTPSLSAVALVPIDDSDSCYCGSARRSCPAIDGPDQALRL